MHKVLMVALELPPCRSAGVQRTLRFIEFLPKFGWQPLIVTATDNIYQRVDQTQSIPIETPNRIIRAQAKDASKQYSFNGRYFQWMTLPDRYWPWYFDGVKQAIKLIEREKPEVIWSTYPVLTAHWIARKLHKKFDIPWIADFRDPLQCRYDKSAQQYSWVKKWMEKSIVRNANKVVFTSERAASFYRELYPKEPSDKFITIENGFYAEAGDIPLKKSNKFQLLYSGSLYAQGRSPLPLFNALAALKQDGIISSKNFILSFRPGRKEGFESILTSLNIDELVEFLPPVSFIEATEEMKQASALVLIQDAIFERQIPGKIYDYICARKPIIAITPQDSATRDLTEQIGFGFATSNEQDLISTLTYLIKNEVNCNADISKFSRQSKTAQLANALNFLKK
ncbi:glycosyltransferase [Thalassotalea ganghwensis]